MPTFLPTMHSLLPSALSLLVFTISTQAAVTTTISASGATLTSTVTPSIVTITPTPSANSSSWTSSSQFQRNCLNSTNVYRSEHNATAIHWNSSLASVAQKWTDRCNWEHSGSGFGENLAEGYANVTLAVDGWGDERKHFDFGDPHFTEQTGHFSQLVWKGSTSMGCGKTFCGNENSKKRSLTDNGSDDKASVKSARSADGGPAFGWFLACEFYPPGNVAGEYKSNVQTQVSGASRGVIGKSGGFILGNSYILMGAGIVTSMFVRRLM